MKNILIAFATVLVSSIAIENNIAAQAGFNSEDFMPPSSRNEMLSETENTASETAKEINQRAVKNFEKDFEGVINESWVKTTDGGYIASFTENSVNTSAVYNGKGVWMHTIKRYNGSNMPEELMKKVKGDYCSNTISGATEINFGYTTVYLVYVQDSRRIKILRVADDEITEMNSYIKG